MLAVDERIPLPVPLLFLTFGIVMLVLNRSAFRDFEAFIRRTAEARARSRFLRASSWLLRQPPPDPEVEFRQMWRWRWFCPFVVVGYFVATIWMLVVSLTQL
jgi:hypothetical protein